MYDSMFWLSLQHTAYVLLLLISNLCLITYVSILYVYLDTRPVELYTRVSMSGETVPKPISKSTRYDRQLRLWGDKGQASLEAAHVCLINASAVGSETLKNLVLPGVGRVTIVDSNKVMGRDLGQNFFLDQYSLGHSRAERVRDLLLEMNEQVTGDSVTTEVSLLVKEQPEFFQHFSVVIATQLPDAVSLPLSRLLWRYRVPLVLVRSYGFIGSIRVATPEHCVVEAKPDNALEDLRFDKPFQELQMHVESVELDKLDKTEHEHVPFLVLIFKYLREWSGQNEGRYPSKYKEKKELKELIRKGIRINPETGGPETEDNFEEAMNSLNTALTETKIPSNIQVILNDPLCEQLTPSSTPFWILTAALKRFISAEGKGDLPLRGSIPDMTSSSKQYIDLQKLYREKAQKDAQVVHKYAKEICCSLGLPADYVGEEEILLFCKNAFFLNLIRMKPLEAELSALHFNRDYFDFSLDDEECDLIWYVLLRAAERFNSKCSRYPISTDVPQLMACVQELMSEWGLVGKKIKEAYAVEMCRYSGCEIHTVSAFLGGLAAQECIKLITKQYIPINNTTLYNAIQSRTLSFEA